MIPIKRPIVTILIGVIIGIIYGLYFKLSIAIIISLFLLFLILIRKRKKKQNFCSNNNFINKNLIVQRTYRFKLKRIINSIFSRTVYFLRKRKKVILILFISIISSNLYTNFINQKYQKVYDKFPEEITTTATIISGPEETDYYYKYNIEIHNKKFLMYAKKTEKVYIQYGMQIKLTGKYIEPDEQRNYKGFNYKDFLKSKKIYGSIEASNIEIIKKNNIYIFFNIIHNIRQKIVSVSKNIFNEDISNLLLRNFDR